MKKNILIIALLEASCTMIFAQSNYPMSLQKGSIAAGGGIAFNVGSLKNSYNGAYGSGSSTYKYSTISFEPRVGYFIANGLSAGLITDYTNISVTPDGGEKSMQSQFTVGPMIRYYLPGGFFIHGDYSFGKNKSSYSSDSDKSNLTKFNVGIGYAIFVSEQIAIEPTIMYRNTTDKEKESEYTQKSSMGEMVLGVTMNFYLNWRAKE